MIGRTIRLRRIGGVLDNGHLVADGYSAEPVTAFGLFGKMGSIQAQGSATADLDVGGGADRGFLRL